MFQKYGILCWKLQRAGGTTYANTNNRIKNKRYNQHRLHHIPDTNRIYCTTFGDSVANAMNMRAFAGKFRELANQSLRTALDHARHMGE